MSDYHMMKEHGPTLELEIELEDEHLHTQKRKFNVLVNSLIHLDSLFFSFFASNKPIPK